MRKKLTLTYIMFTIALAAFSAQARAADEILTVAGFPVTLQNYSLKAQDGVLMFNGKGSIDLSSALGAGVVVSSDDVVMDSNGKGVFRNVSSSGGVTVGGLAGRIASGDIEFSADSEDPINVKVTLNVNVGGEINEIAANLPITSAGVRDTTITLKSGQGTGALLTSSSDGIEIIISSGVMQVKSGQFTTPTYSGSLKLFGSELPLKNIDVGENISGRASGKVDIGQFSLSFPEGINYTYSKLEGLKAAMPKADVDASKVLPGAKPFSIRSVTFASGQFSGEADLQQKISIEGASLDLARIALESTPQLGGTPIITAKLQGSVKLSGSESGISFTGLEVDSSGNINGNVSMSGKTTITLLGMSQTVESLEFTQKNGKLSVGISGSMGVGEDSVRYTGLGISDGKLSGSFDVTESKPLNFSWMPFMKITSLKIENDALKFGGRIDIPDPFPFSYEFKDIEVGADGRVNNQPLTSSRDEAQKIWTKTVSPAFVTLENDAVGALTVSGFKFRLDAITIPNPVYVMKGGVPSETLLKLFLRAEIPLGEQSVALNLDGIEFTKSGVKDLNMELRPPAGQTAMLSREFEGWAKIDIGNGLLRIKNGKIDYLGLSAAKLSVPPLNLDMEIGRLDIKANGALSAKSAFQQPVKLDKVGMTIALSEVSLEWEPDKAPDISSTGELSAGDFKVPFKKLELMKGDLNLDLDVSESKPLSFSWFPYLKITDFGIEDNVLKVGGKIDIPSPFKYSFKFAGVEIDENGKILSGGSVATPGQGEKPWSSITDTAYVTLENTNTKPITISGFSFQINAITLPNPFAASRNNAIPDSLLKLYMKADMSLFGKTIVFNMDGVEVTKSGVKNLELNISPPEGDDDFFNLEIAGVATVSISKIALSVKDGSFEHLDLSGSLSLVIPDVKADILSIKIDADKNITGESSFKDKPLDISICGLGLVVTNVKFEISGGKDISIDMAGKAKFLSDEIAISSLLVNKDGVAAKFDVSDKNPFSFSWFPFLKVTQLEISKNELVFGGKIDTPDPIKYSFSFKDLRFDSDGELVKAAAEGAKNIWEKDDDGLISIENKSKDPLTIIGFSFYIDAITLPNPMAAIHGKTLPDTLVRLYMRCVLPIGENPLTISVEGLELGKDGLKEVTMKILPPEGKKHLISATFFDWAEFRVDSASLVVKGGKFDSLLFSGRVTFDGHGFDILKIGIENGALLGTLKPVGDASIKIGGIKLALEGEIEFRVALSTGKADVQKASQTVSGSSSGDKDTSRFSVTLKKVSVDFTELMGVDTAKILFDSVSYKDGDILAEISTTVSLDLSGIKLALTKVTFASKIPAKGGSRSFGIDLDGSLKLLDGKISLDFKGFSLSSGGDINVTIKPAVAQSFDLYIMSFTVSQMKISKKSGEAMKLGLSGSFTVAKSSKIDFDDLTFVKGSINFSVTRSEDDAIALPLCNFVKLTKLEVKDNKLTLSGFMDIPVLKFRLVAKDITVTTGGTVEGGELKLASAAKINFGALIINIDAASFDLKTMYLTYSGSISLPSEIFSGSFEFKDMGLQLPKSGGIIQDTSKTKITAPSSATDKKHGFPIKITSTSFDFNNSRFILLLNGSLTFMNKFTLNFEGLSIYINPNSATDVSFGIKKVTGSIQVSSFKVEITEFSIDDSGSDPSVKISGGMTLPQFGSVKVTGLQIYKSGKISLQGVAISMDKGAYKVAASISYVDNTFKGAGKITFSGKQIDVAVLFSSTEFKIDISVSGLDIPIFPGVTLEGIGGGVHCIYDPFWMEFKISASIGLGSGKAVKGKVTLTVNTSGIISITGELFVVDTIKLGEANITIDMPNKTVSGYAKINATFGGILNISVQVNIYFSPDTWYVKGTGSASIISVNLGTVNLNMNSSGFSLTGHFGYSSGRISASLDFSFRINSVTSFSVSCTGSGSVDLWIVSVSASISLSGSFSGSELNASASVRGCVRIVFWDKCASATVKIKMNSGGLSISVD